MKKSSKSLLMCMLITGICAGSAQGVFAEEKIGEFNLDQMVVTASRLEESNFEANANVNVVTRKDIEEKHSQTVSDALRAVRALGADERQDDLCEVFKDLLGRHDRL